MQWSSTGQLVAQRRTPSLNGSAEAIRPAEGVAPAALDNASSRESSADVKPPQNELLPTPSMNTAFASSAKSESKAKKMTIEMDDIDTKRKFSNWVELSSVRIKD